MANFEYLIINQFAANDSLRSIGARSEGDGGLRGGVSGFSI